MSLPASYWQQRVVNNQPLGWMQRSNPYGSTLGGAATNPAPGPPQGGFVGAPPTGPTAQSLEQADYQQARNAFFANGRNPNNQADWMAFQNAERQRINPQGEGGGVTANELASYAHAANPATYQQMASVMNPFAGRTLSQSGATGSSVTSAPRFGASALTVPRNVQPQPFLYNHGAGGLAPPAGPSSAPRAPVGPQPATINIPPTGTRPLPPVGPQPQTMTIPIGDDQEQGVSYQPYTPPVYSGGLGGTSPPTSNPTTPPTGGLGGGVTTPTTPLPPGTPGGYGTNPGSPSFGNIVTSINPTDIYSPQDTQRAIHTQQALAAQAGSLPWLLKQYARPGVGQRSASAVGRAMPTLGMLQSEIAQAPVSMQFADDAANIEHRRSGEVAREQEAQGMAGGLLRLQDINRVLQGTQGSLLASLLAPYL